MFLELKRRQKEIYFFKTKNNKEIDFIYYENNYYHLIQVAFSIDDYHTKKRETGAFILANKELKNTEHLLLTYDTEEVLLVENNIEISIKPVWKWLLGI